MLKSCSCTKNFSVIFSLPDSEPLVSFEPEPAGEELCSPGLHAADVAAPDLRGGAALCIAALCADGKSTIRQAHHIARGYEDMAALLNGMGARAEWCEKEAPQMAANA